MAKVKQGDRDYLEEHSKEKVAFYGEYLDLYLTVLLNTTYIKSINIYDLFCGVGIYAEDGSKGSPIIAMESIKKQLSIQQNSNNKQMKLIINDGKKESVERAKQYLVEQNINFDFEAYNLQAEDIFSLTINNIKSSKDDEFNLIFIDPHGYKDIYKKDIINIMNAGKSEILIFLPIHMMYRFLKPSEEDKENPSYEHLIRFMKEFKLHNIVESTDEYIANIKESFSFDNQYFTTSYKLRATNSHNDYALFFITKNIYGLEKAVETKWKLDKLCGSGFEKKKPSLFDVEFEDSKKEDCLNNFKNKLIIYLKEERTNNEIYKFTLTSGFQIKQTNEILKALCSENRCTFDREVRKNSYYLNYAHHKDNEIKYRIKINE